MSEILVKWKCVGNRSYKGAKGNTKLDSTVMIFYSHLRTLKDLRREKLICIFYKVDFTGSREMAKTAWALLHGWSLFPSTHNLLELWGCYAPFWPL